MRSAAFIATQLRRPAAPLFAFVVVAYGFFYQAGGWNQNSRFDLTRSIVERGTASIDGYHRNTGDKARIGRHYFCEKAPGASWLAVPAHAAWVFVAGVPRSLAEADRAAYVSTLWAVSLPSAMSVLVMVWLLGVLGVGPGVRLVGAGGYALATLVWPHATMLYGQALSASLSLAGAGLVIAAVRGRLSVAPSLAAGGLLLGGSVMADYPAVLCSIAVAVYAFVRIRPRWSVVWLIAGGAVPAAALAVYHAVVFGGPLHLPYEFSVMSYRHEGFFMGLGWPKGIVLWHILFSPFRGLFFSAPWLALAVPGAFRMWRLGWRGEVALSSAVALLYLWMNGSMVDPYAGWAVGPRFLVPALPFLALLAVFALPGSSAGVGLRRAVGGVAALLLAYSAAMMLAATAVKPEVPIAIRRPFGGYVLPRFWAGQLAVNTQSIDMPNMPAGAPPRAWNLGQVMGLDGLASLAPLAFAALVAVLWFLWIRRGRVTSSA